MTEYQERRAQYLRDAHDWAEDGDLPDASADYEPITVQDISRIYEVPLDLLETATVQVTTRPRQSGKRALTAEIRKAYQSGRADERAYVVRFLRSGAAAVFTALELASDISGHVHLPEDDPA